MKKQFLSAVAIALATGSMVVVAQQVVQDEVTINGKPSLVEYDVKAVTLERRKPLSCTDPLYDAADTNEDGVLDDVCVGLRYDPCDIHGLQVRMIRRAMTGGCVDKDEMERREARECDGFSPQPARCVD